MYGYYGAGYDLGDYEGDDMGELDGFMDVLKKDVAFGIPVWAVGLGAIALLGFTKKGKSLLGGLMGGAAKKKNPRRRRSRKAVSMKANRRRRNGAVKHNRRRSRRSRR